jgi:O-Antigen ligase
MILPFMTVLSIFMKERLSISGFSFIKELLIISLVATVGWYHISGRQKIHWGKYDGLIALYITILVIISFFTTGIAGILYGGKYDFSFLIAFFAAYHGWVLLEKPISYYIRIFLISWGIMIFISMLLKWPLSEDLLLYIWYSGNPSQWQFGSAVPIFHGVDWANIRRFQWLLDGPNSMAAFLLLYTGVLTYYFRAKKEWYFVIGAGVILLSILIFYTYSRSAALGLIGWVSIVILFLLPIIYKKYRLQFLSLCVLFFLVVGWIFIQYAGNMQAILQRWGSTNGHIERMITGMERFIEKPLGQWLWSAWPAYRYVENLENLDRKQIEEKDRYYIPESWYIQQLIEWWIFGFIAFMSIITLIFLSLFRVHILLIGTFLAICIMNFFLHTFESSILSLSLFLLLAIIIASSERKYAKK